MILTVLLPAFSGFIHMPKASSESFPTLMMLFLVDEILKSDASSGKLSRSTAHLPTPTHSTRVPRIDGFSAAQAGRTAPASSTARRHSDNALSSLFFIVISPLQNG